MASDPDETDTAHHPFAPSGADRALCARCGEAENWHKDDLAALLAAASKGPWRLYLMRNGRPRIQLPSSHIIAIFDRVAWHGFKVHEPVDAEANARLAALAPALAREVLDRRSAGRALAERTGQVEALLADIYEESLFAERCSCGSVPCPDDEDGEEWQECLRCRASHILEGSTEDSALATWAKLDEEEERDG